MLPWMLLYKRTKDGDGNNDNDARRARVMIESCGVLLIRCYLFVVHIEPAGRDDFNPSVYI